MELPVTDPSQPPAGKIYPAWKRLACLPWDTLQLRLARRKTGEEFLRYFIDLGGLRRDSVVLDVGCGRGRMAVPLTRHLSPRARYEGFDTLPASIAWCKRHIQRRYPQFRFTRADVFNAEYNPAGKTRPAEYVFPYGDETFDFVFLASVFTHLLPDDLEHYLAEIARVTRKDGTCLATFFLLNAESLRLVDVGRSSQDFRHEIGAQRTTNPARPEAASPSSSARP